MHNPDQLPLLIAFMLFTFVVMGAMSYLFAKWMKRHKEMQEKWPGDGGAAQDRAHGNDHHH